MGLQENTYIGYMKFLYPKCFVMFSKLLIMKDVMRMRLSSRV